MEESKYAKYFFKEPLAYNIFPPFKPRFLFDSKNYIPELGLGIRYTYLTQPIQMETPHAHEFDQLFCFMGNPEDMRDFDGEVELYLGEEQTKHTITSTTAVFIPKGQVHCPIIWKRIGRPMMFINLTLTNQYTRTDDTDGFRDTLEIAAQKVTSEEAERILGAKLPTLDYLPEGYKIQEIYALNDSVRLLISDKAPEKKKITQGDASGISELLAFECKLDMSIKWHPEGKKEGLDIPGEQLIVGKSKGVLIDRVRHIELWWLLSSNSAKKNRGQYEILISTSKGTPKDTLLKVAESVSF